MMNPELEYEFGFKTDLVRQIIQNMNLTSFEQAEGLSRAIYNIRAEWENACNQVTLVVYHLDRLTDPRARMVDAAIKLARRQTFDGENVTLQALTNAIWATCQSAIHFAITALIVPEALTPTEFQILTTPVLDCLNVPPRLNRERP